VNDIVEYHTVYGTGWACARGGAHLTGEYATNDPERAQMEVRYLTGAGKEHAEECDHVCPEKEQEAERVSNPNAYVIGTARIATIRAPSKKEALAVAAEVWPSERVDRIVRKDKGIYQLVLNVRRRGEEPS
jgi:hypothetical protein